MKTMWLKIILLALITCINNCSGARILAVFPTPSFSHQIVYRALTTELARRGHQVVIVTPDPIKNQGQSPENYKQIDVHEVSYKIWREAFNFVQIRGASAEPKAAYVPFKESIVKIMDAQLKTPEVQAVIGNKTEKFDLLLLESLVRPNFGFAWRFKVPVIGLSSLSGILSNFDAMGNPSHPVLYRDVVRKKIGKLSVWDKINELYSYLWVQYADYCHLDKDNAFARKHFGQDMPSLTELENKMDMLFLNVHPILAGIRPVVPGVVYMGGLHLKPKSKLPDDLKRFLDESSQGVVYMSLGSNVMSKDLPPEVLRTMLEVFAALPYRVLWKYEEELPEGLRSSNVRISKWLPQADLLGHPNIKAFVTQGGQQSMEEAIRDHVPLVGIPFLGDQELNVQNFVLLGIGVGLDIDTFNKEDFDSAIKTVTTDPKYKENMARLSEILSDQPTSSLERAVWWTEYVLRHRGAAHLRAPAAGLPLREYFVLDVVAVVAVTAAAAALLLGCIARGVWRTLFIKPGKMKKH